MGTPVGEKIGRESVGPVLVGDDGSEAAAVAVAWATRFAKERGAELVAVHVLGPRNDQDRPERSDRVVVREGHPAAEIVKGANELDASVIVLGRHGRDGFGAAPTGSTASQVSAVSPLPVIVVPVADYFAAGEHVNNVVVGIDGSPEATDAAIWAVRTWSQARFTAVHALELAPAFAQLEREPETHALYERARTRAVNVMRDAWCRPFIDAGVPFDTVVEEGGPVEILLAAVTRTAADLIVVSRRDSALRRGTLGSVGQRVLAYSACPVAVVPSPS